MMAGLWGPSSRDKTLAKITDSPENGRFQGCLLFKFNAPSVFQLHGRAHLGLPCVENVADHCGALVRDEYQLGLLRVFHGAYAENLAHKVYLAAALAYHVGKALDAQDGRAYPLQEILKLAALNGGEDIHKNGLGLRVLGIDALLILGPGVAQQVLPQERHIQPAVDTAAYGAHGIDAADGGLGLPQHPRRDQVGLRDDGHMTVLHLSVSLLPAGELPGEVHRVHKAYDAVKVKAAAVLRDHGQYLADIGGVAYAGALHKEILKAPGGHVAKRGDKAGLLTGAEYGAVGDLHHLDVVVSQEGAVDAYLSRFVLDDSDPMALQLFKDIEQQRGLAGAEKACQNVQLRFHESDISSAVMIAMGVYAPGQSGDAQVVYPALLHAAPHGGKLLLVHQQSHAAAGAGGPRHGADAGIGAVALYIRVQRHALCVIVEQDIIVRHTLRHLIPASPRRRRCGCAAAHCRRRRSRSPGPAQGCRRPSAPSPRCSPRCRTGSRT